MTTIAVTGPNGRLGSELVSQGCLPLNCDVTNFDEFEKSLSDVDPDVVIHTAAKTNVDQCEKNPDECINVNYVGTSNLLRLFPKRIIFLSTDYVFDGTGGPYAEITEYSPINRYGVIKAGCELLMQALAHPYSTIVRTTILYGSPKKPDFVSSVLADLQSGRRVTVPTLIGNPTNVNHLAQGIMKVAKLGGPEILNISGTDILSRGKMARVIAEEFGYDPKMVTEAAYFGNTPRPINAGFQLYLAEQLNIPLFTFRQGLQLAKKTVLKDYING